MTRSDHTDRALDELWPVAAPPDGFAERVIAEVRRPPPVPRWLVAAVAAALVVVVPAALQLARPANDLARAQARVAVGADLGLAHD
jgi:hypothetical protein